MKTYTFIDYICNFKYIKLLYKLIKNRLLRIFSFISTYLRYLKDLV